MTTESDLTPTVSKCFHSRAGKRAAGTIASCTYLLPTPRKRAPLQMNALNRVPWGWQHSPEQCCCS